MSTEPGEDQLAGLIALNVGAAIAQVGPFGDDLCTGVRTLVGWTFASSARS